MTQMTTNTDNDIHCNDLTQLSSREQLSALMDGALPADQTRFLLRRLQHDDSLAECWERWRITGETMRGLAPAQRLPADFASRVSAALHGGDIVAEKAASARGTARMPAWLRWSGGAAVAASLAMVALVVRQPAGDPAAATPAVQVASAPAVSAPAAPQLPVPTPEPVVADASELVAAAAVVASTRPLRERASTTARTSRQATQAPQSVAAVQVAPASTDALPMQVPQPEIATRPWPRSVLPQYNTQGALAVGFGDVARTHNPFQQPRLVMVPVASEDAQADAQPQAAVAVDAAADAGNEQQPAQP